MKLMHIKDLDKFFEVVDSCKGKVEIVSNDCRLNLKSSLVKYFSLSELFNADINEMKELEIIAYDVEDVKKLILFAMGQ